MRKADCNVPYRSPVILKSRNSFCKRKGTHIRP